MMMMMMTTMVNGKMTMALMAVMENLEKSSYLLRREVLYDACALHHLTSTYIDTTLLACPMPIAAR